MWPVGLSFKIQRHRKEQQHKPLSEHKLVSIRMSRKDFSLNKVKASEVKVADQMFDFVAYEIEGDDIVLFGHYDKKEDKLHKNLADSQSHNQQLSKSVCFSFLYFQEYSFPVFSIPVGSYEKCYGQYLFYTPCIFLSIAAPPPKAVAG